jgi:hypothetical protein
MLIVASLLLGMMMNSGEAMDYRAVPLGNSDIVILMSGPIRRGDLDKLHAFIRNRTKDVHGLYGFALNSPGGDLLEAEAISQFIRKVNALTIVGDGDLCASACFLLFAAATTAMARDAATLGVPPAIIGKMVTMPARGVDFLSRQDLASMDASFTSDAPDDTFRK